MGSNSFMLAQLAGQATGRTGSDNFFTIFRIHSANGIGRMGSKTGRMGSNPGRMGSFLNRPNGLEKKILSQISKFWGRRPPNLQVEHTILRDLQVDDAQKHVQVRSEFPNI